VKLLDVCHACERSLLCATGVNDDMENMMSVCDCHLQLWIFDDGRKSGKESADFAAEYGITFTTGGFQYFFEGAQCDCEAHVYCARVLRAGPCHHPQGVPGDEKTYPTYEERAAYLEDMSRRIQNIANGIKNP